MKLHLVPAREGARWVRRGFRVFFTRPMAFAGLLAAYLLVLALVAQLPAIGWMLFLALLPLGSLGFMIATRQALDGRLPTPSVFVSPLRGDKSRRDALLKVGAAYVVSAFVFSELGNLLDGGAFESLIDAINSNAAAGDGATMPTVDGSTLFAVTLRLAFAALLSTPFWHAPALIYWDGHGWGKAIFSSTAACWNNKGAFVVFGLSWVGLVLVVGTVLPVLFALFGQKALYAFVAAPVSLVLSAVFYSSLYFTFADSFSSGEPPALSAPTLTA